MVGLCSGTVLADDAQGKYNSGENQGRTPKVGTVQGVPVVHFERYGPSMDMGVRDIMNHHQSRKRPAAKRLRPGSVKLHS
jgi:hypothetical protein